ncbi:MAG: hypothetical protein ACRBFS_17865 [Aureispira sp.]
MKEEQEQWLEDILHSAQGKAPVSPNPALLEAIQTQLKQEPYLQLTKSNWTKNWIAAAAIVLGLLNVFAFQQILSNNYSSENTSAPSTNYESLISDYNLYE